MKYGVKAKWLSRMSGRSEEDGAEVLDVTADVTDTADPSVAVEESDDLSVVEDVPAAVNEADGTDTTFEGEDAWEQEAESVRQIYADFDPIAEQSDPRFKAMLQAGVPMLDAYRALHMEDVLTAWSEQIRADAEKRITDHVQARGVRPAENGTAGAQGMQLWQNVHRLTRQKRAEIAGRAHNGERITFR